MTGCHLIYPFQTGSSSGADSGLQADGPAPGDGPALADAGGHASDTGIAAGDAVTPTVDPLAPFGSVKAVVELNTSGGEDDPTLCGDMLEICFERSGDVWCATRGDTASTWSPPHKSMALSSSSGETTPELSPSGLQAFVASNRAHAAALGGYDIYWAERPQRSAPWGQLKPLQMLNSASTDCSAVPTGDLLTLIFASQRSGGAGGYDLYVAGRASVGLDWSKPVPTTELNTKDWDANPWINDARTVLYFSSTRPGTGKEDIWVSTRKAAVGSWSKPVQLGGINTASTDTDPWLSPDLRTIYFTSDRDGGSDLFVATR